MTMTWTINDHDQIADKAASDALRAKYPEFRLPPFECWSGWNGILERLFDEIREIVPQDRWGDLEFRQVKEKLGGLRVYVGLRPYERSRPEERALQDRLFLAVFAAESRSERTCEICGEPGLRRVKGGYMMTRCDAHSEGTEPKPSAETQAAFVPTVKHSDGRVHVYDAASDSVKEVTDER